MHSVDSDRITPLWAVWSKSTLFAQTCLSETKDHYGTSSRTITLKLKYCLMLFFFLRKPI